ncbi:hypothetical protein AB5J52_26125 [Streptomyces sp. R39]|uniref:Uncharacterized protein n=1 Tax=Streptomyces sp. R39 TaxID=3238631 RepID=A0AB39QSB3_9ACTN
MGPNDAQIVRIFSREEKGLIAGLEGRHVRPPAVRGAPAHAVGELGGEPVVRAVRGAHPVP